MKPKTITNKVYLGSLGLQVFFIKDGIKYQTITYPPSNVNPTRGTRWCFNTSTLKAQWFYCRVKVLI